MFLSGGNQQKVVLARWLVSGAKILIFDEPTRGIDVGAKAEVFALMNQLTAKKAAIVMISSEMPEILAMADRILVMRRRPLYRRVSGRRGNAGEASSSSQLKRGTPWPLTDTDKEDEPLSSSGPCPAGKPRGDRTRQSRLRPRSAWRISLLCNTPFLQSG